MNRRTLLAAVAGLCAASPALAQGTFDIEHNVTLGKFLPAFFTMNGTHTYGTTSVVTDGQGREWWATTPAPSPPPPPPGFDNSMLCDFTDLNMYWKSDMFITGIDTPVAPGSAVLFNALGVQIGDSSSGGSEITLKFLTAEIVAGGEPIAVLAWNNECYPDCNADGFLTVADFGCFQTQWVYGKLYTDCNQDGMHTVADFGCFQTEFVKGCP